MRVRSSKELGRAFLVLKLVVKRTFLTRHICGAELGKAGVEKVGLCSGDSGDGRRRPTPLWVALGRREHRGLLQFVVLLLARRCDFWLIVRNLA